MDEIGFWLYTNKMYLLVGFMILEKFVKISPWKWDDILVDGAKEIFSGIVRAYVNGPSKRK
ncbi:MAG: hypothetical protein KAR42_15145 [candidate division Zixibacteria bacterium]|nr:hypothetical protein [candidate division Zixibacteria bacterium]